MGGRCLSSHYINGNLDSVVNEAWRTIQLSICLHWNKLSHSLTSSKGIFTAYNRSLDVLPICQHFCVVLDVFTLTRTPPWYLNWVQIPPQDRGMFRFR